MKLLSLAMILTLLVVPPSQARRFRAAAAAEFDYFLLSLSLAPSFCSLSAANQAKPECQTLTEADFRQTPLTLHGLWPNRVGVSVNLQPHDCQGPPFAISEDVQADLRRYMPSGTGLQRYEWRKHGACSGMPPETYFATLVRLGRYADETLGAALREKQMLGRAVRVVDILDVASERDPALGTAIVVDCRSPRGGGDALIDEIRIVLSKDLRPMPAASVGLGQNSGCTRGAGRVAEVPK